MAARPMVLCGGKLHLMTHLNGSLPVVGHSDDLFLGRGELFVDRAAFLPQLVYRSRQRIRFVVNDASDTRLVGAGGDDEGEEGCLLYTSPSPRD